MREQLQGVLWLSVYPTMTIAGDTPSPPNFESGALRVYRRKVGKVQHDGTDVNLEQLKKGMARHYIAYAKEQMPADREAYANAEAEARTQRRGLWRENAQSAPWEFRRIKAAARQRPKRGKPRRLHP